MKPLICSYSNCQGGGVWHFLKKTPISDDYDLVQVNNWQVILGEQPRSLLYDSIKKAEVLLYQPTGEFLCTDGQKIPSSDELISDLLSKEAMRISYSYQYSTGFFPILKVANGFDGFVTGECVKELLRRRPPDWPVGNEDYPLRRYDVDDLCYDCALRFAECLAEQSRREAECTIGMTDFILANFQKQRLFLTQNHPTSALYAELARRIAWHIDPTDGDLDQVPAIPIVSENEAGMNGTLPVHPAVVRELGLKYPADADCSVYRTMLEQMIKEAP